MTALHSLLTVALTFLALDSKVESSSEVMKELTIQFGKLLDECLDEFKLPKTIYKDFSSYWKEDFTIMNRDTGCIISCLAKKLDMQHEDGQFHKGNGVEFAKKHGADDAMATQLAETFHACEKSAWDNDECVRMMNTANCFKKEVHKLNWAPSPELMAGEFILDV